MVLIPRTCSDLLQTLYRDHEIDPTLGTPLRNHILFPGMFKERNHVPEHGLTKANVLPMKRKLLPYPYATKTVERKIVKQADKVNYYNFKGSDSIMQVGKCSIKPSIDTQKNSSLSSLTSASRGHMKFLPTLTANKTVLEKSKFNSEKIMKSNVVQLGNVDKSWKKHNTVPSAKPLLDKQSCSSPVDIQLEKR